ncbi:MAG: chitobiase/beta-hexosaminidase C-terminal domain-containing protein [Bacteroidaceae bacterium]|nr:chitobiase/beta-hexosaminidase C-terminal domain-containing protein [Bacteroidaceae bacterium]
MKKFLLSLMAILSFVGVSAQVEFSWSASTDWTQDEGKITLTQGNYTVLAEKAGGSNNPAVNTSANDLRVYAKGQLTITAASGTYFSKVVFKISTQGKKRLAPLTVSSGEVSYDDAPSTITWEGNATNSVTFTVGEKADYGTDGATKAGQFDVDSPILITEAEGVAPTVAAPVITPKTGFFTEAQEVSITADEGAEIFYTLNDGAEQKYEAPFTVSETTVIKAYAKVGEDASTITTETLTFPAVYENLAAANEAATDDKVPVRVNFTDALVLYVNGQNTYIQDATGALLIYGTSGLAAGDKVTGYVDGQLYLYNGLPEVANPTLTVETVSSGNAVNPIEVDAAELAANPLKYVSQYVKVRGAKFAADQEVSTKVNINFTVGETALVLRNNFVVEFSVEAEKEYQVAGLVTIYNGNVQLYPTKAEDIHSTVSIEIDYTSKLSTNVTDWKGASGWCATQFAPAITTKDGRTAQLAENYQTNVDATGDLMTQTVKGLPNGIYRVTIFGNAFYTSGRGFASDVVENQDDICYLFAGTGENRVEKFIPAHIATETSENDKSTLEGVVVTDGTLVVGLGKAKAGTNWHTVQVYEITALVDADESLAAAVAEAQAIEESSVPAALYADIQSIVEANNRTFGTVEEYLAAIEALEAIVAKTTPYAPLAAILAQGEAIKANVSDELAILAYDAAIESVKMAFDNVTVTDFNAAVATVTNALPALAKAQTAENSDMSVVVQNAAWTCPQGNGPGVYGDATETYIGSLPGGVAGKVIYQHIEGLPAGNYEVTFLATANMAWIGAATGDNIAQVFANENVFDIPVIGQTACTPADYERTLTAVVGEDGVLEYGIQNIAEGGNWYVVKAIGLKLVKALDATELAYMKAVETLKDGQTYRVFTEVNGNKFYLNNSGYLVAETKKAATFAFTAVNAEGTLYPTGWNLGCQFTNPTLTGGSTGDVVQNGHIIAGSQNRNDWERQVFFLKDGKYAVRSTNANSANWGANTYWTVTNTEAELPNADYQLEPAYVWQVEENVDNRPEAFAKIQSWAGKFVNTWSSNAKESSEGSYEALTDYTYTTYFHSQWSGTGPNADHYLQAEILEPSDEIYFYFMKRSQNNNNRPTQIDISASNDGVEFTPVTSITEGLPTDAAVTDYASEKISLGQAYKYIRFTVPSTSNGAVNNGHVFFTFSEFHIYSSELVGEYGKVTDYTELEDADIEAINAIDEKINALVAQKALGDDIAALGELVDKLQAKVDDTDTYTDEANVAAGVTAALAEIKAGTYTTAEAIEAAKAQVKAQADTFFGSIKPVKDIDITEFYITNATPVENIDGWEGTPMGAKSNGVAEYWNQSGASFHQTVELPAGDFRLNIVALQRTDMTGYVYAGENKVEIATVGSDIVNGRSGAAVWFDEGNGVNEVNFTMEAVGSIEIGLKADESTGDHWTVWRSFQLILLAPESAELAQEINVERYTGMGYTVTTQEVDFAEAKAFLGVEEITTDMLRIVNPDGTEISDYAPFDGWFDADGTATSWAAPGDSKICVKFFQALEEGNTFEICDMNGADEVGATYNVKWALVANDKKVIYTINVTFVEPEPVVIEISDLVVEATVEYDTEATYAEKKVTLTDEQVQSILTELGIASLDEADVYGYNPTTQELIANYAGYDGWRDANGDFAYHTGNETVPFCVKYTDGVTYLCYNIATADYHEYAAYWAISNGTKAVLVKINFITATAINGIEADTNKAEVIFDLAGRRINKAQKGIYIINGKKVAVK